jgi:hypothetical protein
MIQYIEHLDGTTEEVFVDMRSDAMREICRKDLDFSVAGRTRQQEGQEFHAS